MYWLDSSNRDKSSLIETDMFSNVSRVLYSPNKGALVSINFDPRTSTPWGVVTLYDKTEDVLLDNSYAADLQFLATVSDGVLNVGNVITVNRYVRLNIANVDYTMNRWLVAFYADNLMTKYYLYDRRNRQASFLFHVKSIMMNYQLSKMTPVEIRTRDGLTQLCYLSIPVEADPRNRGRPDRPIPMVLLVHGGPWGRNVWRYDQTAQLLTNRGYAVLQCNFRASTGFGKAFLNAGNGEWARKMHDDLLDGVNWAVNERVADRNRIAIRGGSYGGYSTLVGLTFTPDVFACGVDIYGPVNLVTLLNAVPAYWKPFYARMIKRVGGDPRTPDGQRYLMSRSPISKAGNIRKPLLVGQGANDPR